MAKSPPKKPRTPKSKASRPDAPETPESLADLLNPGIARGTAGLGSGTGGIQPPPATSWERRKDFSAAHTARKSAKGDGFAEAAQRAYTASPITGLDPALAEELGIAPDEGALPSPDASFPSPRLRGEGGEHRAPGEMRAG